ncbi:MAG: M20/M25/M40 family metallo-hydrolase [Acholeplasmatales bacterium]|nr:MAG: M20/M25/M40 family metallo-hydrolase [Acholeplasmatales bacterium]
MIPALVLTVALTVFIAILLIRTFRFKPQTREIVEPQAVPLDETRIITSLSAMIRFKTISHPDASKNDTKQFEGFRDYLIARYPRINTEAKRVEINGSAVLYKLAGRSSEAPSVLMSHYDVVPQNGTWKHDPFCGEVIDGHVYGRGTLDTKTTLLAVMEAVEHVLAEGKTFERDLYLAFAGDEEVFGQDALAIVDYFEQQGIQPGFVLDEGGAVTADVFPGVKGKVAVVGTSEKGVMSLELVAAGKGGHASTPEHQTPITILATAINRLNHRKTFSLRLTQSVKDMFDTLGRESSAFGIRLVFANLWLFWPIVKRLALKSGGQLLSMMKTTQAFTMMQGSEAVNVLPSEARVGVNYRLLTGETQEQVLTRIEDTLQGLPISIHKLYGSNPTPVSLVDDAYGKLEQAIKQTFGDLCITPYLMMATTDSRHYHRISNHVYRFSPLFMGKTALKSIHGVEEQVPVEDVIRCVTCYVHLLNQL